MWNGWYRFKLWIFTVKAEVINTVESIKNPFSGTIKVEDVKDIILDDPNLDFENIQIIISQYYDLYQKNNTRENTITYYIDMATFFYSIKEYNEAVNYYVEQEIW